MSQHVIAVRTNGGSKMLKTITLLLLTLTTLLLVNTAQTSETGTNFRAPAVSTPSVDRGPAFVGTIELI